MNNHINEIYKTTNSCDLIIIDSNDIHNVKYKFLDEHGYIGSSNFHNIKLGHVRNPFQRDSFGGYNGVGIYNGKEYDFIRSRWKNIIIRANADKSFYKNYRGDKFYYNNTIVCEEWMCYNTFAEWFMNIMEPLNKSVKYDIDKDLKYPFYKDQYNLCHVYNPLTVSILPHSINVLLEGNALQRGFKSKSIDELAKVIKDEATMYANIGALYCDIYMILMEMDFEWFFRESGIIF